MVCLLFLKVVSYSSWEPVQITVASCSSKRINTIVLWTCILKKKYPSLWTQSASGLVCFMSFVFLQLALHRSFISWSIAEERPILPLFFFFSLSSLCFPNNSKMFWLGQQIYSSSTNSETFLLIFYFVVDWMKHYFSTCLIPGIEIPDNKIGRAYGTLK